MAKKKKVIDAEPVEVEPQSLEAEAPVVEEVVKEPTLTVRSRGRFIDGGLAEDFKKYGYSVNWKDGEVRNIPVWLYKKCLNSGGRFDIE